MAHPPIPYVAGPEPRPDAERADGQPSLANLLSVGRSAKATLKVLVVDAEPTVRETCASTLRLEGYLVTDCARGDEALDLLKREPFDIVLVERCMSQADGMSILRAALGARPETIVIVMTGDPTVESSLEALREGAWDYLPKPFTAVHLQVLVGRAAHAQMVARETRAQRDLLQPVDQHGDKVVLLGRSPAIRMMLELARRVAPTDASVFITGESGSGKELIAQFIHQNSRRSSRPFVAINCAALPEPLLESEMFGHRKGAFTGAVRDKPGLLETANGGTLFLDELMEMPRPIQAKLLRVLQDGVLRRVGSETTDAIVNVRFIAATNGDPEAGIKSGDLREDLFYRLRVVPIRVPPLRERPDDIPMLADHFLSTYWRRYRRRGSPPPTLSEATTRALLAHPWRGNVRELQNVIEHVAVLVEPGAEIRPEALPLSSDTPPVSLGAPGALMSTLVEDTYHAARSRVIAQFELQYLHWLVNKAEGNMSKAARIAGVDRTTLYRMMERHGLHRTPATAWMERERPVNERAEDGMRESA